MHSYRVLHGARFRILRSDGAVMVGATTRLRQCWAYTAGIFLRLIFFCWFYYVISMLVIVAFTLDSTVRFTVIFVCYLCRDYMVKDSWPVIAEDFSQWVIEENFCNGMPAWDKASHKRHTNIYCVAWPPLRTSRAQAFLRFRANHALDFCLYASLRY